MNNTREIVQRKYLFSHNLLIPLHGLYNQNWPRNHHQRKEYSFCENSSLSIDSLQYLFFHFVFLHSFAFPLFDDETSHERRKSLKETRVKVNEWQGRKRNSHRIPLKIKKKNQEEKDHVHSSGRLNQEKVCRIKSFTAWLEGGDVSSIKSIKAKERELTTTNDTKKKKRTKRGRRRWTWMILRVDQQATPFSVKHKRERERESLSQNLSQPSSLFLFLDFRPTLPLTTRTNIS